MSSDRRWRGIGRFAAQVNSIVDAARPGIRGSDLFGHGISNVIVALAPFATGSCGAAAKGRAGFPKGGCPERTGRGLPASHCPCQVGQRAGKCGASARTWGVGWIIYCVFLVCYAKIGAQGVLPANWCLRKQQAETTICFSRRYRKHDSISPVMVRKHPNRVCPMGRQVPDQPWPRNPCRLPHGCGERRIAGPAVIWRPKAIRC